MKRFGIIVLLLLLAMPSFAQHMKKDGKACAHKCSGLKDGYYTSDASILGNLDSKYKTLKLNYNKSDYYSLEDPRFGLALPWVNVLIPGLAQYVMDEPGLGTTYLLLGIGCSAVTSAGGVLARQSLTKKNNQDAAYNAGMIMVYAGSLGSLVVGILSIINAYDVVKVKSLYIEDVKNYRKGYSFSLQPTVNFAVTPNGNMPAPGMGLRVAF